MKSFRGLIFILLFLANSVFAIDFTDEELVKIANEINKTMPRVMDQFTTAINVNAIPRLNLNYIYELDIEGILIASARQNNLSTPEFKNRLISKMGSIDNFSKMAIERLSVGAKNQYCSTSNRGELEPRFLAEKGVTTVHNFYNKKGIFVGLYSFDKNTCR